MKIENQFPEDMKQIINDIKTIIINSRSKIATTLNLQMLQTYWKIGKIIAEEEKIGTTARSFILNLSKLHFF